MPQSKSKSRLSERAHLEGCPGGREETYVVPRPKNQGEATVVRCIECGGHAVISTKEEATDGDEEEAAG